MQFFWPSLLGQRRDEWEKSRTESQTFIITDAIFTLQELVAADHLFFPQQTFLSHFLPLQTCVYIPLTLLICESSISFDPP